MKSIPRFFAPPGPAFASRRDFLTRAGNGFGLLALAGLLEDQGLLGRATGRMTDPRNPLAPRPGHVPAKARSVIWLFLNGGPSQVDTWDYKPQLAKRDGQELKGFDKNTGFFTDQVGPVMKSPFRFSQHGECGKWGSEIFPNIARHVDKMAFIHSCWTTSNNHSPALFMINTGMSRMGFPCMGSWVTYGLGSQNKSLPGFVTMYDTLGRGLPKGNASNWGSGFLPSIYQGTVLKPTGAPIDNLFRAEGVSDREQRSQLDLLKKLNQRHLEHSPDDSELAARIESFELAYRMQMAAPECLDLEKESRATQSLYGLDNPRCKHVAKQCLIARRLVERGVRFVQIYSGGMENERSWDGHQNIVKNHAGFAAEVDIPIAGLLTDLAVPRPFGFDAGPLLRGIRPAADRAKGGNGPRSQSARLHHLDGRRRSQGGRLLRRDGRNRLQGGREQSGRPRSARDGAAPSWASSTRGSPTATAAAISA